MPKAIKKNIKFYAYVENENTEDEEILIDAVGNIKVEHALSVIEVLSDYLIENEAMSYLDIQNYLFGEKLKREIKHN
jgi:hypothetical protein